MLVKKEKIAKNYLAAYRGKETSVLDINSQKIVALFFLQSQSLNGEINF